MEELRVGMVRREGGREGRRGGRVGKRAYIAEGGDGCEVAVRLCWRLRWSCGVGWKGCVQDWSLGCVIGQVEGYVRFRLKVM